MLDESVIDGCLELFSLFHSDYAVELYSEEPRRRFRKNIELITQTRGQNEPTIVAQNRRRRERTGAGERSCHSRSHQRARCAKSRHQNRRIDQSSCLNVRADAQKRK